MTAEERLKKVHDQLVWLATEAQPEMEPEAELEYLCKRVQALCDRVGRSVHIDGTIYKDGSSGGHVLVFTDPNKGCKCIMRSFHEQMSGIFAEIDALDETLEEQEES